MQGGATDATRLTEIPPEVILQILAELPVEDLLSLRLTSKYLSSCAASNKIWLNICHSSWSQRSAMIDVLNIPPHALSLTEVVNGWMRAYATVEKVAAKNWLSCNEDMTGTFWLLYFKMLIAGSNLEENPWPPHSLIEYRSDMMAVARMGVPFRDVRWRVSESERIVHVSAYPPICPSRDPDSWLRTLETYTFLMVTESPEFLHAIFELDKEICNEVDKPQSPEIIAYLQAFNQSRLDENVCQERLQTICSNGLGRVHQRDPNSETLVPVEVNTREGSSNTQDKPHTQ